MNPKIINKDELKLVGCVFYGNPFHSAKGWDIENEIGKLWQRFITVFEKFKPELESIVMNPTIAYEVHIDPVIAKEEKKWYIFVGVEVKKIDAIPLELFCVILPKTKYAIYTTKGNEFQNANDYLYNKWLPKSKFKESYSFQIQAYDSKRYFGMENMESEIDFYVPIK